MFDRIVQFFYNLVRSPAFVVVIKDGAVKATHNHVKKAFVEECNELCKMYKIRGGKVYGMKGDYGIRLEFSASIPKEYHQRFRNVWSVIK